MCLPAAAAALTVPEMISIAGMAMQGMSTLSNMKAQKSQVNARNAVAEQERQRQQAYQADADAVNADTQAQFTREQQDARRMADQEARNKQLTEAVALPDNLRAVPTSPDAPDTINSQIADSISKALGYGKKLAGAQAALGSYAGGQFGNSLTLNRAATSLGQTSNNSARSSSIAGLELEGANQAGGGARQLGDLFRLGGNGLSIYGMTRPAPNTGPKPNSPNSAALGSNYLTTRMA